MAKEKDSKKTHRQKLQEDYLVRKKAQGTILLSPEKEEIAIMEFLGFDCPWEYGRLEPLQGYKKYQSLFQEAVRLEREKDNASNNDDLEGEEHLWNLLHENWEKQNEIGFIIFNRQTNKPINYITLNITGLKYEYK